MKLRRIVTMLLAAIVLACIPLSTAHARTITMLFWYPGEAGSTAEAQPVLDEFTSYLNGKIAPDTIRGKYFNTVEGGLTFISKDKPQIGIVSYAAWTQQKSKMGNAAVLLSTLPLPGGKTTENYALAGPTEKIPDGAQVFTSEPLEPAFVRSQLFPDLPATVKLSRTPQLIMKLKEIGDGKSNACAILTPTEAATLAQVSAQWSQGVKTIAQSKPVPSARVVLFDQGFAGAAKLKAALLSAGSDQKAKDILNELRLVGFSE